MAKRELASRQNAQGVYRCRALLFPGGVGKTASPEDFTSLLDDVTDRVFDYLPNNTWFYPGHGDDSTLGEDGSCQGG
jgi:hypothetical protein